MKLIETIKIPADRDTNVEFSYEELRAVIVATALDTLEILQRYAHNNYILFSTRALGVMKKALEEHIERLAESSKPKE